MNGFTEAHYEECLHSLSEFFRTFGASLDPRLWAALVREEKEELEIAFASETPEQQLKEAADLVYVGVGFELTQPEYFGNLLSDEEMDELNVLVRAVNDLMEKVQERFTDAVLMEAFRRVHASNLSKLDDEGKPIRRFDGKILKGPHYHPPVLSDLVA